MRAKCPAACAPRCGGKCWLALLLRCGAQWPALCVSRRVHFAFWCRREKVQALLQENPALLTVTFPHHNVRSSAFSPGRSLGVRARGAFQCVCKCRHGLPAPRCREDDGGHRGGGGGGGRDGGTEGLLF